MKVFHFNNRRELVDEFGHKKTGSVMRDGEAISVAVQFMDSAPRFVDASDDGQAAYESRIAGAWKDSAAPRFADANDDGQELYERRMNDAWKATPEDFPEAA